MNDKRVKDMDVGDRLVCSKCGEEAILTKYMKKIQTRICSKCQSKTSAQWARDNREIKRKSNNEYQKRIPNSIRSKKTAAYREKHKDAHHCHILVQSAVRRGDIIPGVCSVCGDKKSHAHHDDYSKPLDVKWLCHKHHMEYHAMIKAREGA